MSLAVKAPARPLLVVMGGSASQNKALKDIWAVGDVGYGRVLVRVNGQSPGPPGWQDVWVSDSGGFSWTELEAFFREGSVGSGKIRRTKIWLNVGGNR